MQQMDLFLEPETYELPPDKRWGIYQNPTSYQRKLNQMYVENYKTLELLKWYSNCTQSKIS